MQDEVTTITPGSLQVVDPGTLSPEQERAQRATISAAHTLYPPNLVGSRQSVDVEAVIKLAQFILDGDFALDGPEAPRPGPPADPLPFQVIAAMVGKDPEARESRFLVRLPVVAFDGSAWDDAWTVVDWDFPIQKWTRVAEEDILEWYPISGGLARGGS